MIIILNSLHYYSRDFKIISSLREIKMGRLGSGVSVLQSLTPLGIEIVLEKEELPVSEFKKDPLQSNRIWINNRLLEDWIEGEVGHSPCCDVCGPHECRTVEVKGQVFEVISADMIIKAGLIAASQLFILRKNEPCCEGT